MPVVGTTRYGTAGDVLDLVRSLMNDPNGVLWTSALLFPFLNSAYRGMQEALATTGISVLQNYAEIDLPLTTAHGATLAPNPPRIADDTDPSLPADCVVPFTMEEMATGSSDVYVSMEKIVGPLPNFAPLQYLRIWKWEADQILLIGATQPITVKITYERALPALSQDSDPVLIPSSANGLAFAVAALAARSRGARDLAIDMEQAANNSREALVNRHVRAEQCKARRKRPYGRQNSAVYL